MLKQQQEVVGFDSSQYLTRLLWASSTDDVQVPISMAYRGGKWSPLSAAVHAVLCVMCSMHALACLPPDHHHRDVSGRPRAHLD